MAAKMCKDPVQMSMRDVCTDYLDPFHQWSSQKVGDASRGCSPLIGFLEILVAEERGVLRVLGGVLQD